MKQTKPLIFAIAFLICLYILFFQPEWLVILIVKDPEILSGSLISWFMIVDLSLFGYTVFPSVIKSGSILKLKKVAKVFIFLSLFWGVFSFLLAGNWNWTFTNMRYFIIWLIVTSVFVLFPLSILIILIFLRVKRTRKSD